MGEENIPRKHLANVCEDQEAHVIALLALFSDTDSNLEGQAAVVESIRLHGALRDHLVLRREALDLLALQIAQLRDVAKRQHALLRDLYRFSWEDTRFTSSGPQAGGEMVAVGSREDEASQR